MYKMGQWVQFNENFGFIVAINKEKQKLLVQIGSGEEADWKWYSLSLLKSAEEVMFREEDIAELQFLAAEKGDLDWYKDLKRAAKSERL